MNGKRFAICFLMGFLVFGAAGLLWADEDVEGSKDHPVVSRMPGFSITAYEERDFGAYTFEGDKTDTTVEGHYIHIEYSKQDEQEPVSDIQLKRNIVNALKKVGATVVDEDTDSTSMGWPVLRLAKDGSEMWIRVRTWDNEYYLDSVQKEAMDQVVTADAAALANSIKATGHVAVYGIYFDTGKATLKPDSKKALDEMAKLLKADPSLKVYVVGNTDTVGDLGSNMTLSKARAEAVAETLVKNYGIAPERLSPQGIGPLAPVTSNAAEGGRAQNRRVELVQQ